MPVLIFGTGSFRQSSPGTFPRADPDHRRKTMDTTKILADLKKRPGFTENVGMVLVHNGVVRGWARADHAPVKSMKVSHDRAQDGRHLPRDGTAARHLLHPCRSRGRRTEARRRRAVPRRGPGTSANTSRRRSRNSSTASRPKPSSNRNSPNRFVQESPCPALPR